MKLLRYVGVAILVSLVGLGSESAAQAPGCTVTLSPGGSIQEAIDRAATGDVICLQAGEWQENLIVEKSLTLRAAEVKPELNAVIKSAKEDWPVILIKSDKPIEVTVIGLKITGAFGECYQREPEWICADGISVHGQAHVAIENTTISGNRWDGIGMGAHPRPPSRTIRSSIMKDTAWRAISGPASIPIGSSKGRCGAAATRSPGIRRPMSALRSLSFS